MPACVAGRCHHVKAQAVCVCLCACVRACVRACVYVKVRVCMWQMTYGYCGSNGTLYVYVCVCVCVCVRERVCVCVGVRTSKSSRNTCIAAVDCGNPLCVSYGWCQVRCMFSAILENTTFKTPSLILRVCVYVCV